MPIRSWRFVCFAARLQVCFKDFPKDVNAIARLNYRKLALLDERPNTEFRYAKFSRRFPDRQCPFLMLLHVTPPNLMFIVCSVVRSTCEQFPAILPCKARQLFLQNEIKKQLLAYFSLSITRT